MSQKTLRNILKGTAALTLSVALSASNTFASDMPDEEKQIIGIQSSQIKDVQLALPLNNDSVFSFADNLVNAQDALALYNKAQSAVRFLNSEDFKNNLNNLLTWAAYNESKHLYKQHSDKFIAPLAGTLVDVNFALAKYLILKTTGLSDVVKAAGILTGDTFSLPQKPGAYIRENHSQFFMDICRLKFLTDAINEKIIAPHLVAPCLAYAVHKADMAGAIQQHLVKKMIDFLDQQKPALERKAKLALDIIEQDITQTHNEIKDLEKKIASWDTLPEALKIQILLDQNTVALKDAQKQEEDQNKIVEEDVKKMSSASYYLNYLPGTSTESQSELKVRRANVNLLSSGRTDLEKAQKQIKSTLDYKIKISHAELLELETEKDQIKKGLNGEEIAAKSIEFANAFVKSATSRSKKNLSQESFVPQTVFAGMSWEEMLQPCPHINYRYLQWIGGKESHLQKDQPAPVSQDHNPYVQAFINMSTQAGASYLEVTGVTKAVTKMKEDLDPEVLTKKLNRVMALHEKTGKVFTEKAQERVDILEDNDSYKVTKAARLGGSYLGQLGSITSNYLRVGGIVTEHTLRVKEDAVSLGNALSTAALPAIIIKSTLTYTAPVWALSYMTSYALDISMPYGTGLIVPLTLGVIDGFDLWAPALEYAAEKKNAFVSRLTYAHAS